METPLHRNAFTAIGRTFRGDIIENAKRFRLKGPAYNSMPAEQDGFFSIESARQLAGPLAALADDGVREVGIIGATQVLKSVCGNIWLPFVMEHDPGDALVAFENDEKALSFADKRLMPTIRGHPTLSARILRETDNRHAVTKTKIVSDSMNLDVGGLNDTTVSTFSIRYVWVSEAWQHGSDGLLMKAIRRADRFPDTCKILIESQAGLAGQDLHQWAKGCHQVPLTWACPYCDGRQTWEFSQLRPDGFTPRPVLRGAAVPPPASGSYAGMTFDGAEKTLPDGTKHERTIDERARSAHWQCYWCGSAIADRPEIRKGLALTYRKEYRIEFSPGKFVSPRSVVFYLPKEANCDNKFEASTKGYLTAKEAQKFGNDQPIIDWYINERGVFFDPILTAKRIAILSNSTDASDPANEAARVMGVDCQQGDVAGKTGKFWYEIRTIDKDKKVIGQPERGFADTWQEWWDVQDRNKIQNENVGIDCGNYLDEILDAAASRHRWVWRDVLNADGTRSGEQTKTSSVWKLLRGNGLRNSFPWGERQARSFSKPIWYRRRIPYEGGQIAVVKIPVYEWSSLSVKDHFYRLLTGGANMPAFTRLKHEQLSPKNQEKERGDLAYDRQLTNQQREHDHKRNKDRWVETSPNVHYADTGCECVVMLDMGGFLGLPTVPDTVDV